MKMRAKLRRLIFLSLIFVFIWLILIFFFEAVRDFYEGLLPFVLFSGLGLVLLLLLPKSNLNRRHHQYLVLTGAAAVGVMTGVLLHNLAYALGVAFGHLNWVYQLSEFLYGAFFVFALAICPIGFIVGVIGSFLTRKSF